MKSQPCKSSLAIAVQKGCGQELVVLEVVKLKWAAKSCCWRNNTFWYDNQAIKHCSFTWMFCSIWFTKVIQKDYNYWITELFMGRWKTNCNQSYCFFQLVLLELIDFWVPMYIAWPITRAVFSQNCHFCVSETSLFTSIIVHVYN